MHKATAKYLALCLIGLIFPAAAAALTVDPPHGTGQGYSCVSCHTGHVTLGSSGFNNICLSCHRPGVPLSGRKPFTPADAADPFQRYTAATPMQPEQTSHRWEGSDTVPLAGAEPPLQAALTSVRSKTGGELACVRCHNQHDNSIPPFLRGANDQDQLCLDCHRSRDRREQLAGTHPVNFGYADPGSKAVTAPARYHNPPQNANPGNASSDLGNYLKGGKLLCSTCHGVHYADSSSATFDSFSSFNHLSPGDGFLLRTDRRGAPVAAGAADRLNVCTNCHAGKKNHNFRGQDVQCGDCHGAHVDPADGSQPNSFLVRRFMNGSSSSGRGVNRPVFTLATSALSASFKDRNGTGVCQACHPVPAGVTPAHDLPEARAADCSGCHYHDSALGSFSGGCGTCHGYPITAATIGGPSGLATPPTGVLGANPTSAGAHGTHVTNRAIQCLACHSGYTQSPMGNGRLEMGFGVTPLTWAGFVGSVNSGTINANSSLNPGYAWSSAPGTTLNLAPGQAVSCNVYCHGTTLTGGGNNAPVWTGSSQAFCGSCHGVSAAAPPTAGSHRRHAGNGPGDLALACVKCHGNVTQQRHVNGTVLWDLTQADPSARYRGTASGSTGNLAPSASYGACSNLYCHSSVQGVGGIGAPTYAAPTWGGAPYACDGCHGFDMTGPGASGSHRKHFTSGIGALSFSCASCHLGAGAGSTRHADGNIDVILAAGSYSQSPNPPGNGYGSCAGVACHAGTAATWGVPLAADCSGCHGGNRASAAPMATGAHPPHMNNVSTLGAGNSFGCALCHAATVSGDRGIANPARHIDGQVNYSGARAGQLSVARAGACSNNYCHSDGRRQLGYWNLTGAAWFSGRRLDCHGCHGGATLPEGSAPAFTSSVGEPNYANGGPASGSANSHQRHAADAGATTSTFCATCHLATVDAEIPAKLRDYSSAHLDGARTLRFKAIAGVQGRYSSATQQCLNTYCHSSGTPAWGGASFGCNGCHQGSGSLLPAGHAAHWQTGNQATSYLAPAANGGTATAYQFSCPSCHGAPAVHAGGPVSARQTAQIFFAYSATGLKGNYTPGAVTATDGSFSYSNGTCSATYCHSNGNGGAGNNSSFTWISPGGTLGCNGCHDFAAIATGRHAVHVAGYAMSCVRCHSATTDGSGITDKRNHANRAKDVAYDSFNLGGGAYQSPNCSGIYCHSAGTSLSAPYAAPGTVPSWRASLPAGCSGCHGGLATGPAYPNGSPKANSHAGHVVVNGQGCHLCHAGVTSDGATIANPALHVNRSYDLAAGGGAAFTVTVAGTPTTPTQCSDISCHGGAGHGATWGTTPGCQGCHLSAGADADVFTLPFTVSSPMAAIAQSDWLATGHGRAAGSYRSGNPAAGFTGSGACLYCHDGAVGHNAGGNLFRLLGYSSVAWGRNQPCQSCHAAGATGVTVGSVTVTASRKISSTHLGPRHGAGNSAGQFCWDCHDPHGDQNDYMIHDRVALASDRASGAPAATAAVGFVLAAPGAPAWDDFVKPGPGFGGICQVCHRAASNGVSHFTAASFDAAHNPGTACIDCHSHSGANPRLAFQPSGNCNSCHGYPPAGAGFVPSQANWSAARLENYPGGGGAHTESKHVKRSARPSDGFANCDRCHNQGDHVTSPTVFLPSANVRVRVNPSAAFVPGVLPRYSSNRQDGPLHVTGRCSNINCHFGASPKWDPAH